MDNPYPKWKSLVFNPVDLRQFFGLFGDDPGEHYQALIAGCGTGRQVVDMALANPNISITAIDLSPTSLAYARQMANRFGISNVEFKLLDILDVATLNQQFDYIMSTGVLHHMASPQAGLTALSGVLNQNGVMLLGFYSEMARRPLADYRKSIAESLGIAQGKITPTGIKQWRAQLQPEDKQDDWFHTSDFFYLNGLMDALFHPTQHEYQLPELGQMLDSAGLNFQMMAVTNHQKAKYQEALTLVDPFQPGSAKAESLTQWHQLEQQCPDFFATMYNFFATKQG
jgi:2-polyprenyl-3-methyl-5-hydroxy-6-metoxy-1,4-benzoquinol methylase